MSLIAFSGRTFRPSWSQNLFQAALKASWRQSAPPELFSTKHSYWYSVTISLQQLLLFFDIELLDLQSETKSQGLQLCQARIAQRAITLWVKTWLACSNTEICRFSLELKWANKPLLDIPQYFASSPIVRLSRPFSLASTNALLKILSRVALPLLIKEVSVLVLSI